MSATRRWRRPPRIERSWVRGSLVAGALLYGVAALASLDVNWERLRDGLPRALSFAASFLRPDLASRGGDVWQGLGESLAMTAIASVLGIALSVPVGLGAARNLAPLPVYLVCRALLTLSRSFHEVIVAIFFVVMVGFGPLAGVLTLAVASVGFLAKLLAEDIEDVRRDPVEAIRATGASRAQTLIYGVVPQVLPRFVGLSIYRLDINFRESAVIGVVGAGGIGATLNTAFDRYEFDTAAAILLIIVGIVLAGETLGGRLRRRFL